MTCRCGHMDAVHYGQTAGCAMRDCECDKFREPFEPASRPVPAGSPIDKKED
jgi:hypothetical protein